MAPRFFTICQSSKAPVLPVYIDARNSALFYDAAMLYKPLATMLLAQKMFRQKHKSISMRVGELIPFDSFAQLPMATTAIGKLFKKHLYRLAQNKKPLLRTETAIAPPEDRRVLRKAIETCPLLGQTSDGKQI